MLYVLLIAIHVLIALFLIGVILLQGGRGGLGEALGGAAAQSLFGGGANVVMSRLTAVVAGLFFVTCLSLALLSRERGRSVMERLPVSPEALPGALPLPGIEGPSGAGVQRDEPSAPAPAQPGTDSQ